MKQAPKWLRKKAAAMYMDGIGKLHFAGTQIVLAFSLYQAATTLHFLENPSTVARDMILFLTVSILSMFTVLHFLKKHAGKSDKWQKKYLQSKIDEYEDYASHAGTLKIEAEKLYKSTIKTIEKNMERMEEKWHEAKQMLIQIE